VALRDQMRKGSSEILILALLADEPMHGYQITQELSRRSRGYFEMKEGLLYPTLHRMEHDGLLASEWLDAVGKRRRKVYRITQAGRQALTAQKAEWSRFAEQLMWLVEPRHAAADAN
jgi:PadR family transcriptional regulator PadR